MLGTSATRDGLRCSDADASPSCARHSARLSPCTTSDDVRLLLLGTENSELPSHDESSASTCDVDVTSPLTSTCCDVLRNLRGVGLLTSLAERVAASPCAGRASTE